MHLFDLLRWVCWVVATSLTCVAHFTTIARVPIVVELIARIAIVHVGISITLESHLLMLVNQKLALVGQHELLIVAQIVASKLVAYIPSIRAVAHAVEETK